MTSVLPPASLASPSTPTLPPPEARAPLSSTHPFTCNTCQVAFRSSEQQRNHMHTDWHRYNLKRRISSLPPLPAEVFAEKVLHIQATNKLERERASFEKACKACNKSYYSENAYANHVGSLKHRQNVAAMEIGMTRDAAPKGGDRDEVGSVISSTFSLGDPIDSESEVGGPKIGNGPKADDTPPAKDTEAEELARIDNELADKEFTSIISTFQPSPSDDTPTPEKSNPNTSVATAEKHAETETLPLEACLFCNYISPSLTLNVKHMSKTHGLFIPEQNFLVDLKGLIGYLGEKIMIGHTCLYCNKQKNTAEAIQTHMRDKGHCKLAFESEDDQLELGDFYDFRPTYSDGYNSQDEQDDKDFREEVLKQKRQRGGLKSDRRETEFKPEGGNVGDDQEGWETDSSASSLDSTELCAVPLEHHHSSDGGSGPKHHMEDGWHSRAHSHSHTHATAIYHTDYELHLGNGRTAGHRSLARYYKQKLSHPLSARVSAVSHTRYPGSRGRRSLASGNSSDVEEVEEFDGEDGEIVEEDDMEHRQLTRRERRDLVFRKAENDHMNRRGSAREWGTSTLTTRGAAGLAGVDAKKRAQVIDEEKRGRRLGERERRKYEWGNDKKGNYQKHYRDPLLQ